MSNPVSMVMPMAGRGSRFAKDGMDLPKPLLELAGKPFFYWATLGVVREFPNSQLVYVVLREHVEKFQINNKIREIFPHALVVTIDHVTSGALETVLAATPYVNPNSILIVNDCDHAFSYSNLSLACRSVIEGANGFLSHFHADIPHFSFAEYTSDCVLLRTAEKKAISNLAIAGVYGFKNIEELHRASQLYISSCPYPELFISGVYNEMVKAGALVKGFLVDYHVPFGTPEEFKIAQGRILELQNFECKIK